MLQQLLIGTLLISTTVVIQVLFIGTIVALTTRFGKWLTQPPFTKRFILALIAAVLWLVAGISVCAWVWAFIYIQLDILSTMESALYFTLVTMTTLGYGDITLDTQWRLLSGLTAVNGLIIFGLTTAFLVEFISIKPEDK